MGDNDLQKRNAFRESTKASYRKFISLNPDAPIVIEELSRWLDTIGKARGHGA